MSLRLWFLFLPPPSPDPANGHAYVDLGLRLNGNKILFATENVKTISTEAGDFFAWGETDVRYDIALSEGLGMPFSSGADFNFPAFYQTHYIEMEATDVPGYTKYVMSSDPDVDYNWAGEGSADNLVELEPEDDAAAVNWGGNWRTPSKEEIECLIDNTDYQDVHNYNDTGRDGMLFIGRGDYADKQIFIPYENMNSIGDVWIDNDQAYIMSRSLGDISIVYCILNVEPAWVGVSQSGRDYPASVRPVLVIPE